MRVPEGLEVGVCSHIGLVRGGNEDDYLLAAATGAGPAGFVAAIADGMGGVAGGAEASRTALRALGGALLDGAEGPDAQRMRRAFAAASERVLEAADAVPALRDMGTTMTAVWFGDGRAVVGHVGDTRLYRVREGACRPLTEDHAVGEGESLLTRCIGGGQADSTVDEAEFELAAGDRFVLVSDGVWNVVPEASFARLAASGPPAAAAERLVQAALDGGGPDNATAVVVDVRVPAFGGRTTDVDLPRTERPGVRAQWPRPVSLRVQLWPWLVLAAAVVVLAWAGLRLMGVDVLRELGG